MSIIQNIIIEFIIIFLVYSILASIYYIKTGKINLLADLRDYIIKISCQATIVSVIISGIFSLSLYGLQEDKSNNDTIEMEITDFQITSTAIQFETTDGQKYYCRFK